MHPSCTVENKKANKADLILYHAYVYPVQGPTLENGGVVVLDGKIVDIGNSDDITAQWEKSGAEMIDCKGAFLMPGFIEGHGHFSGLGHNLIQLDLLNTTSWEEVIDSVAARVANTPAGTWIVGRGWHQEKWSKAVHPSVSGYPYHDVLSSISPEHPVMLKHASGHSLIANKAAMDLARVSKESPDPPGGKIIRNQEGNAIGVFEENAMDIIASAHNTYQLSRTAEDVKAEWYRAIDKAQDHCFSFGITSFQDAGSTVEEINRYDDLAKVDSLEIRLWAMLCDSLNLVQANLSRYPIIRSGKDKFTCRAMKAYIDGALGSYGAWLLEPYVERPGFRGQNTTPLEEIKSFASLCLKSGMQMAVHAIGDKGNRTVLDMYEEVMSSQPDKKDLRWRIEHAQHIDPVDMGRFAKMEVIASMQAIHCISDAPFVEKRIGTDRARTGAYAWRSLLDKGVVIANGTDAPVERVDPIPNFYASVTRKRIDTGEAFFPDQSMTREEALKSMTISNAYAAFEEDIKGSIEKGKWADLVLLSDNLLTCPEDSILKTRVLMTVVGGKVVYEVKSRN